MDEATSALDEAGQDNVMRLLIEELPDTAVVSIGHRPGLEAFHTRELVLEPGEDGRSLRARAGERGLRDIYRKHVGRQPRRARRAGLLVELPQDPRRPLSGGAATHRAVRRCSRVDTCKLLMSCRSADLQVRIFTVDTMT